MGFSAELQDLFDQVKDFKESHDGEVWFRGQTSDFPLNSGLFRPGRCNSLNEIRRAEITIYRNFLSLGHPYLKGEKDWELLFIMQHHRVRTRLLDWTPALMTALYFATEGPGDSSVLWMLSPTGLNYLNGQGYNLLTLPLGVSYEDFLYHRIDPPMLTSAIMPIRNSARQVVQQGMFTFQGDPLQQENGISGTPLELEWGGEIVDKNILKKITISKELREDIKYFLYLNGMNRFTVYPDLDGLGEHLNDAYLK